MVKRITLNKSQYGDIRSCGISHYSTSQFRHGAMLLKIGFGYNYFIFSEEHSRFYMFYGKYNGDLVFKNVDNIFRYINDI